MVEPSANPAAAASSPPTMLPMTLDTAGIRLPSSSSRSVSYENVEYVLSAPQNPVPSASCTPADAPPVLTTPARRPRTSEPTTLTVNVPQGSTVSCRACTARSVRKRSGAPIAAPARTSSRLIAGAPERTRAASSPPAFKQPSRGTAGGPDGQQCGDGGDDEVGHRGAGMAGGEQALEVDRVRRERGEAAEHPGPEERAQEPAAGPDLVDQDHQHADESA